MDYICIEKLKDKHGKIVKYRLKDTSGKIFEVSTDVLKNSIANGKVNVINLRLTSDHRLYSTSKTTNSTGLAHIIDIKYRVVDSNNNDCWYVDSNGSRYTNQQINELKNGTRPKGLDGLQYRKGMKILLKYDKAKIIKLSLIDPKLCIVCEDSKSCKVFYERIIRAIYPNLKFDLYTSDGNTGFNNVINNIESINRNKYKTYIIISGRQQHNSKYIVNLTNAIATAKIVYNKNVRLFKPICVEEVILSSPYLRLSYKDKLFSKIRAGILDYLISGKLYYTYNGAYNLCGITVYSLEQLLYKVLNQSSILRYNKSEIDTCFFTECCPMILNSMSFCNKCDKYIIGSVTGYKVFKDNSLIGGLQNIINDILGCHNQLCLLNWSKDQLYNLYS